MPETKNTTNATGATQPESDGLIVIRGTSHIHAAHLLALKGALTLESKGLRRSRGPSALAIVRKHYGIKARTAAAAVPLFLEYLAGLGIVTSEAMKKGGSK